MHYPTINHWLYVVITPFAGALIIGTLDYHYLTDFQVLLSPLIFVTWGVAIHIFKCENIILRRVAIGLHVIAGMLSALTVFIYTLFHHYC
jgi:hypothetical protein